MEVGFRRLQASRGVSQWWGFEGGTDSTGGSSGFLPVASPCLPRSMMNVQACSRCGYGVYPAEKISCIDQVSGFVFMVFGKSDQLGILPSHVY